MGNDGKLAAASDERRVSDASCEKRLERVLALLSYNELDKAFEAARELVAAAGDGTGRYLLARIYDERGDDAGAREQLEGMVREGGGCINAALRLAERCWQRGAQEEGTRFYCRALRMALASLKIQLKHFLKLLDTRNGDALGTVFLEINAQLPSLKSLHASTGHLHLRRKEFEAAYQHLLLAYLVDPAVANIRLRLARAAVHAGHGAVARHLFVAFLKQGLRRRATSDAVAGAKRQALVGLAAVEPNDDVLRVLDEMAIRDPHDDVKASAAKLLGELKSRGGGGGTSAPEELPVAVRLESALLALLRGKREKALDEARAISTEDPCARFVAGMALASLGRGDEAEKELIAVSKEKRNFVNPLLILMKLSRKKKDRRGIFAAFARAVQRSLALLESQLAMFVALVKEGGVAGFPRFVQELAKELPVMATTHKRSGRVEIVAGEASDALRQFLLAHECDPQDEEATLGLAQATAAMGRHDAARHLFCNILEGAPRNDGEDAAGACLALEGLASLPRSPQVFEVFKGYMTAEGHPDVRLLARRFFHEWREDFEEAPAGQDVYADGALDVDLARDALAQSDPEAKLNITMEFCVKRDESALPVLLDTVQHEQNPLVLSSMVRTIGAIGQGHEVTWSTLQQFLKHDDAKVRAETVMAMEGFGDDLIWTVLVPLLQDPDDRVKANTVKVLMLRDEDEARRHIEILSRSGQKQHRECALFGLGVADRPWVEETLAAMIGLEKDEDLLRGECKLLGTIGTQGTIGFLASEQKRASGARSACLDEVLMSVLKRFSIRAETLRALTDEYDTDRFEQDVQALDISAHSGAMGAGRSRSLSRPVRAPTASREKGGAGTSMLWPAIGITAFLVVSIAIVWGMASGSGGRRGKPRLVTASKGVNLVGRVLKVDVAGRALSLSRGKKLYLVRFPKGTKLRGVRPDETVKIVGTRSDEKHAFATVIEARALVRMVLPGLEGLSGGKSKGK